MTDGNTYAINKHLDEREDYDALQEVTAELEQAEARIEELEAENKLLKSMIADVIHDTGEDPRILAASRAEWAARALAAEAKLVKVTEELEEYKWMYEDLCK
jgi:seryl-tRNA synthetase